MDTGENLYCRLLAGAPFNLVGGCQRFAGAYCLHLRDRNEDRNPITQKSPTASCWTAELAQVAGCSGKTRTAFTSYHWTAVQHGDVLSALFRFVSLDCLLNTLTGVLTLDTMTGEPAASTAPRRRDGRLEATEPITELIVRPSVYFSRSESS
jgi:hypothetical protein